MNRPAASLSGTRAEVHLVHRSRWRFISTDGGNWFDRAIVAGVIALVVFTPLAIGSVHPWAFIAAETAIFAIAVLWMAKIALRSKIAHQPALTRLGGVVLPLGLFITFCTLQLIALPPALLRLAAPSTYEFYVKNLGGWPQTAPYQAMLAVANAAPSQTAAPVAGNIAVDSRNTAHAAHPEGKTGPTVSTEAPPWRPLSTAPALTRELVLKLAAYAALFLVVSLYPFGPSLHGEAEKRFFRYALVAILFSGFLVAFVGVLERVFWNGKILWVFVPFDWGRQLPELSRARGPFVNADHFGAFLNLVLPIALAGLIFPTFITRRNSEPYRVFCGLASFMISIALLLSLSRASWLGAIVGCSLLVFLSSFIPRAERPALLRLSPRLTVPLCAALMVLVLASSSLFVGDLGRHDADVRLQETVNLHQSLGFRIGVWRDTFRMVRDFPLFGVGIGAFGDVFPHYQSPPWSYREVRETHNDYLQLLSEGGVVGFSLLLWFFVSVASRLYRGLRVLPPDVLPVAAALLAAMGAMAFQEFSDFNLQIPANAILFTILLALAMRLIATARLRANEAGPARSSILVLAAAVTVAAIVLGIMAVGQDKVPYPYNLRIPTTPLEAREMILAHPGYSRAHIWLVGALERMISPAMCAKEVEVAVWDDPINPGTRDLYARSLLLSGDPAGALRQVTLSVFNSPWLDDHFYLTTPYRKLLSPVERDAVEKGLQMAVEKHFKNAVWALGGLYGALGQQDKRAQLFGSAAASEPDPRSREDLLVAAGGAYAIADDPAQAEEELRAATKLDPTDYRSYSILATMVYAPHKDLTAAKAVVNEGIGAGADPFELYLGLADASKEIGDLDAEESALSEAVGVASSDFAAVSRLASVYMKEHRFDQAVLWQRRATEIRPDSAEAFYQLGLAEEAGYQYFAAERDLGHAAELAPQDPVIKAHYGDFERKLVSGSIHDTGLARP